MVADLSSVLSMIVRPVRGARSTTLYVARVPDIAMDVIVINSLPYE